MSETLTRHFEHEMEAIQEGKTTQEKVVEEGKKEIAKICEEFRPQEQAIGKELLGAVNEMQRKASVLGKCNKCGKGEIVVRRGKFGLFAACNAYPACANTFPLPKDAAVIATGKQCKHCSLPIVKVVRRGKRPFEMCLTPGCESKAGWGKNKQAAKAEAETKTEAKPEAGEKPKKKEKEKEKKERREK
jgi:DNA topoisomerase-1